MLEHRALIQEVHKELMLLGSDGLATRVGAVLVHDERRDRILQEASTALSRDDFSRAEAAILRVQLAEVLSDVDPFWMRWNYMGQAKGWLPRP
jgi:hypothetical protein